MPLGAAASSLLATFEEFPALPALLALLAGYIADPHISNIYIYIYILFVYSIFTIIFSRPSDATWGGSFIHYILNTLLLVTLHIYIYIYI